jgi:hypothetical protein
VCVCFIAWDNLQNKLFLNTTLLFTNIAYLYITAFPKKQFAVTLGHDSLTNSET